MTTTIDPPVIDLADCIPQQDVECYEPERIIAWLRTSGGSLGERAMKCAAADLIENASSA